MTTPTPHRSRLIDCILIFRAVRTPCPPMQAVPADAAPLYHHHALADSSMMCEVRVGAWMPMTLATSAPSCNGESKERGVNVSEWPSWRVLRLCGSGARLPRLHLVVPGVVAPGLGWVGGWVWMQCGWAGGGRCGRRQCVCVCGGDVVWAGWVGVDAVCVYGGGGRGGAGYRCGC